MQIYTLFAFVQMVWSEDEACVQKMCESLEYMTQPKRALFEVWGGGGGGRWEGECLIYSA